MGWDDSLEQAPAPVRHALESGSNLTERVCTCNEEWQGRIFSVQTLDVELPDGSHGYREVVRHHGGAAVVAVRDGRVCLVRQYRVAQGRMTLEIPAGKLEPGEAGASCAARELMEETGLVAARLEPLLTTLGSPGFTDEHTEVFLATGLSQGPAAPDEGEFVDAVWLLLADVRAAIRCGCIQDAKTVAGVLALPHGDLR